MAKYNFTKVYVYTINIIVFVYDKQMTILIIKKRRKTVKTEGKKKSMRFWYFWKFCGTS